MFIVKVVCFYLSVLSIYANDTEMIKTPTMLVHVMNIQNNKVQYVCVKFGVVPCHGFNTAIKHNMSIITCKIYEYLMQYIPAYFALNNTIDLDDLRKKILIVVQHYDSNIKEIIVLKYILV